MKKSGIMLERGRIYRIREAQDLMEDYHLKYCKICKIPAQSLVMFVETYIGNRKLVKVLYGEYVGWIRFRRKWRVEGNFTDVKG